MKWLRKKRVWIGLFFLVVLLLLRYVGFGKYITLETIQLNRCALQKMVIQNYWAFVCSFLTVYVIALTFLLPLSLLLTLSGGFFFGAKHGMIISLIGATIGSTVSFLLIRYFFGQALHDRYKDRLKAFNRELKRYGSSYLLSIHFFFIIPFSIPNVLAGLANIPLWTFFWTTFVGLIPGMFIFSSMGQKLMTMQSLKELVSFNLMMLVVLLFILSLAPMIPRWIKMFKKSISKK